MRVANTRNVRGRAGTSLPVILSGMGPAKPPVGLNAVGSASSSSVATRPGNSSDDLAHDARNLFSALNVYCDLLAGPGVLTRRYRHYAHDLRVVSETGVRLLEALAAAVPEGTSQQALCSSWLASPRTAKPASDRIEFLQRRPLPMIENLADEVQAMEPVLRGLAGPGVRLEVDCLDQPGIVRLNAEELLRILFNLIANAVEAMHIETARSPGGIPRKRGTIRITVQAGGGASFLLEEENPSALRKTIVMSVRDNGPGIPDEARDHIFKRGYSTRDRDSFRDAQYLRGAGLAIVRQLVESAGGAIRVVSSLGAGSRFDIELPVLKAFPQGTPHFEPKVLLGQHRMEPAPRLAAPEAEDSRLHRIKPRIAECPTQSISAGTSAAIFTVPAVAPPEGIKPGKVSRPRT